MIIRMTSLGTLPAKQVLAYQLFAIGVLLWVYAIATDQAVMHWQTASMLSVGFQTVFVAFLATVAFLAIEPLSLGGYWCADFDDADFWGGAWGVDFGRCDDDKLYHRGGDGACWDCLGG